MNKDTLDFFKRNKNLKYIPPSIPLNLTDPISKTEWIMNNMEIGWLELDIDFNLEKWKTESSITASYAIPHRDDKTNLGWNSCCIHGIGVDKTQYWTKYVDHETPDIYHWTEISKKTPNILKFWKDSFPIEHYERIRFMVLQSKGFIAKHKDYSEMSNYNPLIHGCSFNIAINQPKNCYMVVEGFGIVPFKDGKIFYINTRHNHVVLNFSDQDRLHMIGTGLIQDRKNDFSNLMTKSYIKQFKDI